MKKLTLLCLITLTIVSVIACSKLLPAAPADDALLDGPIEGLTNEQQRRFLAGDIAFNDEVFTSQTGLGPIFSATSCASCHAGDGKGHPFTTLTRFGQSDTTGNKYLDRGGPQLQDRALPGYQPEQLPAGASFSRFTPPANTGLGLLELVPDADLLALADPNDLNNDGISGVVSLGQLPSFCIPSPSAITVNGKSIHRFGKKAAAFDLLHQTVNAYNQDMGISSSFSPIDTYTGLTSDPELADKKVRDVVFYLQTLKAPIQRNVNDAMVIKGQSLFNQINCSSCHTPELKTGLSNVSALSQKVIHPYTDMLLHDMGPALDDGYTEGSAKTAEWRTPALWGLGLSPNSQGGKYFLLHDGRAASIEEAIVLHGGEATGSKNKFIALTRDEKQSVISFLKSL